VRIGRYEVEGTLGRGGMGVVYRARSPEGGAVAVKLLTNAANPVARQRFDRERRLLDSLGAEQGFVPLLDEGEEKGQPFFVMRLLEGGTLRERLAAGALPVDETIALAESLAAALARAHERGIVHRDLKPENVLFDRERRPFVADLGIAKHLGGESLGASRPERLTRTGQLVGTFGYMPPEQIDGGAVAPSGDVFSLGAILHECLTGIPVFVGDSVVEVLAKIVHVDAAPVARARPGTPAWFAATVDRALARDPRQRYADGAALLAALRAREAGRAPARRRKVAAVLATAALSLLVIAGGVALATWQPGEPAGFAPPAPGPGAVPEDPRVAAARARLEGEAPVASADAPVELLLGPSPGARGLVALAARRAVVYSPQDGARFAALHGGVPGASVLAALSALHGSSTARRGAESALASATGFDLAAEVGAVAHAADAVAVAAGKGAAAASKAPEALAAARRSALASHAPPAADAALAPLTDLLVAAALADFDSPRHAVADAVGIALGLWTARPDRPPLFARAWDAFVGSTGYDVTARRGALALEALAREAHDPALALMGLSAALHQREVLWENEGAVDDAALEEDVAAATAAFEECRAHAEGVEPLGVALKKYDVEVTADWILIVSGRPGREERLRTELDRAKVNFAAYLGGTTQLLRLSLEADEPLTPGVVQVSRGLEKDSNLVTYRHGLRLGVVLAEERRRESLAGTADTGLDALLERFQRAPYIHSERALVLADRDRFAEARRELELGAADEATPPPLTCLGRAAVLRYVEEREAKAPKDSGR
jgi:hypothetical protein